MFFDASQGSLMAKICTISRPLANITMRDCLAMRGALRAPLIARERLMVIFARGRKIVPIFAMSDAWLASKNTEHPPRAPERVAAPFFSAFFSGTLPEKKAEQKWSGPSGWAAFDEAEGRASMNAPILGEFRCVLLFFSKKTLKKLPIIPLNFRV